MAIKAKGVIWEKCKKRKQKLVEKELNKNLISMKKIHKKRKKILKKRDKNKKKRKKKIREKNYEPYILIFISWIENVILWYGLHCNIYYP